MIGIWIFSGLLVLCGALTLAELGAMLPQSGGLYVYMREAYGPFWAFLYGWTIMLVAIPASIAALTSAFLLYLKLFVPMTLGVEKGVGIGILLGPRVHQRPRRQTRCGRAEPVHRAEGRQASWRSSVLALVTMRGEPSNFLPLLPERASLGPADRHRPVDDLDALRLRRLAVRQLRGR